MEKDGNKCISRESLTIDSMEENKYGVSPESGKINIVEQDESRGAVLGKINSVEKDESSGQDPGKINSLDEHESSGSVPEILIAWGKVKARV